MSHGTQAGHLAAYGCVRAASDAAGHSVGVLIDLQGPKIRLGTFAAGPVRLLAGQEFTITTREVPGDQHEAGTTYAGLADDVRPGDRVLVDDGRVVLGCSPRRTAGSAPGSSWAASSPTTRASTCPASGSACPP